MSASGVAVLGGAASGYNEATGSPFTLGNNGTTGTIDTASLGRWMSLQILANASANTLAWEGSDDGATWRAFNAQGSADVGGSIPAQSTASSVQVFNAAVPTRYVRVRVSSFVAGTTTFSLLFHPTPSPLHSMAVDTELPSAAALADSTANPTAPAVSSFGLIWNTSNWSRQLSVNGAGDSNAGSGIPAVGGMAFNGASNERLRVANVVKTATATASGDTALWTPAAGKKFRLMRLLLQITEAATQAVGGDMTIALRDVTTAIGVTFTVTVPGAALTTAGVLFSSGWIDLGNGVLSSAINQALNINLSAALATGLCRVIAIGTEE